MFMFMFIVVTYESIGRRLAHLMRLFAANYTIVSDKVHGSEAVSLSIQSRCTRNLIHSERVASISVREQWSNPCGKTILGPHVSP